MKNFFLGLVGILSIGTFAHAEERIEAQEFVTIHSFSEFEISNNEKVLNSDRYDQLSLRNLKIGTKDFEQKYVDGRQTLFVPFSVDLKYQSGSVVKGTIQYTGDFLITVQGGIAVRTVVYNFKSAAVSEKLGRALSIVFPGPLADANKFRASTREGLNLKLISAPEVTKELLERVLEIKPDALEPISRTSTIAIHTPRE